MAKVIAQKPVASGLIRIMQGDLTVSDADAIVNAANSMLQHGGGVAGAIVRRGGAQIQQESDALAPVPEGAVAVTGAGQLAARYVIHAVGPRGGDPLGDQKLRNAVENALQAAGQLGLQSVAFPAISTGIFGFPLERAAEILTAGARQFLEQHPEVQLQRIDFVLIDEPAALVFAQAIEHL